MSKKKINYPSKRKVAGKKKCPLCDKLCAARGLKSHILLAHKLKWTQVTGVSPAFTQVVTPVSPEVTGVSNKSYSGNPEKPEKNLDSNKTDVTQVKPPVVQVSQESVNPPLTQVSPENNIRLHQLPRYTVEQMKALERPIRTEGLIEVSPKHKSDANKNIRYCSLVERDRKIQGKVYRIDAFKSGKVPVWYYNEVVLIDVQGLVAHFDSERKKGERNLRFNEANKEKAIR